MGVRVNGSVCRRCIFQLRYTINKIYPSRFILLGSTKSDNLLLESAASLLQSATAITKCSYATSLFQNVTGFTKCSYATSVFQSATGITSATVISITKCDSTPIVDLTSRPMQYINI